MNDLAIAARQLRSEQKAFWRNPAGAVFTFAFPLLFLVVFSTLNSGKRIPERGNISFVTFFVPGILAFPLLFVSGIFFPLDNAPEWLTSGARAFPMQQLADGLQYAFDPRTTGLGFNGTDLWSLLAWTVAGSALAIRLFRWDSHKK